jgi:hypothetical protein
MYPKSIKSLGTLALILGAANTSRIPGLGTTIIPQNTLGKYQKYRVHILNVEMSTGINATPSVIIVKSILERKCHVCIPNAAKSSSGSMQLSVTIKRNMKGRFRPINAKPKDVFAHSNHELGPTNTTA